MDNKTRAFIEEELYPLIISPIEVYIKPQMTVQEKVIAKQQVFLRIKELLRGAQIYTGISVEEIIDLIEDIMQKRKCLHEGAILQNELVKGVLDEIKRQRENEDKTK